jgi:hypothetical protein
VGQKLASRELMHAVGLKASPRRRAPRQSVVDKPSCPVVRAASLIVCSLTLLCRASDASNATPGQAGLPAEFKHINKRRKRNLQGFP